MLPYRKKNPQGTVASWWLSEVTHHSGLGSSQPGTSQSVTMSPHPSLVYAEETKDLTKVSPLTEPSELPLPLYGTESQPSPSCFGISEP